jgi:HK97 family phage major capsid protein
MAVRKLKDSSGRYLWSEATDRLLDRPVVIWEQMEDIGANLRPIFFGDFRRAYVLADRIGPIRITRDELTAPGFIRFYLRRRVGGTVRNGDALKVLKTL